MTSLVVALAALAVSVYSWGTATRAARNDVLAQVRDWGADVVDFLADAGSLCALTGSNELDQVKATLRSRASALLDRGRFFFPNLEGLRPQILDLLMIAFQLIPGISPNSMENERRQKAFHHLQAVFVSTVKKAVNFSVSPASVKKYEEHLAKIQAQPLPNEILELMANDQYLELTFDGSSLDDLPSR